LPLDILPFPGNISKNIFYIFLRTPFYYKNFPQLIPVVGWWWWAGNVVAGWGCRKLSG